MSLCLAMEYNQQIVENLNQLQEVRNNTIFNQVNASTTFILQIKRFSYMILINECLEKIYIKRNHNIMN